MRVHLHRFKHVNDLVHSLGESLKLSEDVHLRKVELSLIFRFLQPLLGAVEAIFVAVVQLDAVLQFLDDLVRRLCPDRLRAVTSHICLAGGDHLIGDLKDEEKLRNEGILAGKHLYQDKKASTVI